MKHLFNETQIDQLVLNRVRDARQFVEALSDTDVVDHFDKHLEALHNEYCLEMLSLVGDPESDGVSPCWVEAPRGGLYDSPTVRGFRTTVEQQYEGDRDLFRVTPSTFDSNPPKGSIGTTSRAIFITAECIGSDTSTLRTQIDDELRKIRVYLQRLDKDVIEANKSITRQIHGMLELKRTEIMKSREIEGDLGFRLKVRGGPTVTAIPLTKRSLYKPSEPSKVSAGLPSQTVSTPEYSYILDVCQGMGIMMERAAASYSSMVEEDLRHIFLGVLNTHYVEQATGETFNGNGKTDILIKTEKGIVFAAECKNWSGEQSLVGAITQVLGYLTWRDTKAAVLVFNRDRKDFSKIKDQIAGIVRGHGAFVTAISEDTEAARFQYRMKKLDDESVKIDLTVLAFDLPKKAD